MTTLIDCPSCRRKLRVPDEFLGQSVRCPSCAETFRAPETAAAPAPAPEPPPAPDAAQPSPLLTVPLKLELDDGPPAPRPAAAAPPKESPPERRRGRKQYDDDGDDEWDRRRRSRSRRRRDFEPCPRCGDDIRRGAVVCPYCGLDLEEQGDGYSRRQRVRLDAEPHRGGTVQGLGIASLVLGAFYFFPIGLPLGIAAWLMGRSDLKKMEAGVMDPSGRKKTKDGWLCGLVGTCLNTVWGLGLIALILFSIAEAASNAPGPPPRPRPPAPVRPAGKQGWPQQPAPPAKFQR